MGRTLISINCRTRIELDRATYIFPSTILKSMNEKAYVSSSTPRLYDVLRLVVECFREVLSTTRTTTANLGNIELTPTNEPLHELQNALHEVCKSIVCGLCCRARRF